MFWYYFSVTLAGIRAHQYITHFDIAEVRLWLNSNYPQPNQSDMTYY